MSVGGLFTLTGVEDTLTAHAGGTQAAALALSSTKNYHRISVCATAGDSVLLPAATVGQSHFVRNDGAASCQVFGTSPDTIDGVATATGIVVPAGSGAWFVCTTAGKWYTDLSDGAWNTYVPTISADTGTWTTNGIYQAKYRRMGKVLFLSVNIGVTVASGLPTQIQFTLPESLLGKDVTQQSLAFVMSNSVPTVGSFISSNGNIVYFSKWDASAFVAACQAWVTVALEVQ